MHQGLAKVLSLNFMGCLWGYIGMSLIRKGLPCFFQNLTFTVALALICLAVGVGVLKSQFVLKKTALRLVARLDRVSSYFSIFKIMDLKFLILIMCMMALGLSLSLIGGFDVPKGMLRVAIGYGLLQSSFYFFKPAFIYRIPG